jgi:hypothetical protein
LVIPVKWLAELAFYLWQDDLFNGIAQQHYLFQVQTLIFPKDQMGASGSKLAVLDVLVNPMKYGYGLAVFTGLVLSLPTMTAKKRVGQIVLTYVLVCFIQANGVFWETCKTLLFSAGPDAFAAINETGISHSMIAVMYQMSYLILPAVIPLGYWPTEHL